MIKYLRNATSMLLVIFFVSACAVTPRVSSWDSPPKFTKIQVFNASIQAGGQSGMKIDSQDRESGAISFSKHIGKGEFILNVQIAGTKGGVNVQTTGSYGGDLAIRGLHEEVIRNFHVLLFRILRITDPASRQIKMEQLK